MIWHMCQPRFFMPPDEGGGEGGDDDAGGGDEKEERSPVWEALFGKEEKDEEEKTPEQKREEALMSGRSVYNQRKQISLNDIPKADPDADAGEKKEEEKPAGDEKPKAGEGRAEEKKPDAPAATSTVKVKGFGQTDKTAQHTPAPVVKQEAQPEKKDPPAGGNADPEKDPFEDEMLPVERENLDLIRKAESIDPDKFKGLGKKFIDHAKKAAEYVAEKIKEDPDYDFSSDEKFKRLRESNPLDSKTGKAIERSILKDELRQEQKADLEEVKRKQHAIEQRPVIAQELNKAVERLPEILPDEVLAVLKEKGHEEAKKQFPLEYGAADEMAVGLRYAIERFLEISRGVRAFNPQEKLDQEIFSFLKREQEEFIAKAKPEELNRNGRPFILREKFNTLPPHERDKHWTLSNDDIIGILIDRQKEHLNNAITAEHQRLESMGYQRSGAAPAAPVIKKAEGGKPNKPQAKGKEPPKDEVPSASKTPAKAISDKESGDTQGALTKALYG